MMIVSMHSNKCMYERFRWSKVEIYALFQDNQLLALRKKVYLYKKVFGNK